MFSWNVYIRRSLAYYWRTQVWVVLGTAVSTAILSAIDDRRFGPVSVFTTSHFNDWGRRTMRCIPQSFFPFKLADSLDASLKNGHRACAAGIGDRRRACPWHQSEHPQHHRR